MPPMNCLRAVSLIALFLSGCGASAASTPEATATPRQVPLQLSCAGDPPLEFAPLSRECSQDSDCVAVRHRLDCCGSYTQVGINAGARAAFEAAEAACEATVAMCRCPSRSDVACDGTSQAEGMVVRAQCMDHGCETTFEQP